MSRRTVKATVLTTNLTLMSNRALRLIFARAADGLPLAAAALDRRGEPRAAAALRASRCRLTTARAGRAARPQLAIHRRARVECASLALARGARSLARCCKAAPAPRVRRAPRLARRSIRRHGARLVGAGRWARSLRSRRAPSSLPRRVLRDGGEPLAVDPALAREFALRSPTSSRLDTAISSTRAGRARVAGRRSAPRRVATRAVAVDMESAAIAAVAARARRAVRGAARRSSTAWTMRCRPAPSVGSTSAAISALAAGVARRRRAWRSGGRCLTLAQRYRVASGVLERLAALLAARRAASRPVDCAARSRRELWRRWHDAIGHWLAAWASAVLARPRGSRARDAGARRARGVLRGRPSRRQHRHRQHDRGRRCRGGSTSTSTATRFPLRDRNLLIVVDAPTPARADEFAAALLAELRARARALPLAAASRARASSSSATACCICRPPRARAARRPTGGSAAAARTAAARFDGAAVLDVARTLDARRPTARRRTRPRSVRFTRSSRAASKRRARGEAVPLAWNRAHSAPDAAPTTRAASSCCSRRSTSAACSPPPTRSPDIRAIVDALNGRASRAGHRSAHRQRRDGARGAARA